MGLETRSKGNTTYLQIDYGKKSMYIWSGEEKEGFEKHVSDKGKVSYRKYVNAVSGKLSAVYFKDGNFGPELTMVFEDSDGRYSLSFGIDSSVFMNIARSIENVDISKNVRLAIYEHRADNGKSYFGTSLSYPDILNEDGKATLIEWGDELPKGKQLRTGKWDFSEPQDEAYGRFEKFIESNDFSKNSIADNQEEEEVKEEEDNKSKSSAKNTSKVKRKETQTEEPDEDDDLPF